MQCCNNEPGQLAAEPVPKPQFTVGYNSDEFNDMLKFTAEAPHGDTAKHVNKQVPQAVLDAIKWCEDKTNEQIIEFRNEQLEKLKQLVHFISNQYLHTRTNCSATKHTSVRTALH